MATEKILITGGTGFIGGNLVMALFEKKYEIKCLVRKNSRTHFLDDMGVELAYGDITDKASLGEAMKDVSVVFHLAGILGKWGIPSNFYTDIHLEGTKKMLETCIEQGVRRFIYCSTSGVLGPIQNPPADESRQYNPSNIYEYVKTEAEKAVLGYREKLDVTVIRPGLVYGPRDMHTLPLFKSIKNRRFFIIGDGKALIHPTYVKDLSQGFVLCLENKKSMGEVYLIVGESYVTVEKFVAIVSKNLGFQKSWLHVPIWIAKALAGMTELAGKLLGFEPPLTYSRVKFFTENRAFSYSKAERDLGYRPMKLEEGIKETITWYSENGCL
jgi:nucleoside-diphosphate-sugar epimerase